MWAPATISIATASVQWRLNWNWNLQHNKSSSSVIHASISYQTDEDEEDFFQFSHNVDMFANQFHALKMLNDEKSRNLMYFQLILPPHDALRRVNTQKTELLQPQSSPSSISVNSRSCLWILARHHRDIQQIEINSSNSWTDQLVHITCYPLK